MTAAGDQGETAPAVVAGRLAADGFAAQVGITCTAAGPGRATVELTVSERHLNPHGICHGGVVFTLADTAFGLACNTGRPPTVAHTCDIAFVRPARPGDHLVATAGERVTYGRSTLYDVTITCGGQVVAEFRGNGRALGSTESPAVR